MAKRKITGITKDESTSFCIRQFQYSDDGAVEKPNRVLITNFESFVDPKEEQSIIDECKPGGTLGVKWNIKKIPDLNTEDRFVLLKHKTSFMINTEGSTCNFSMAAHPNMPDVVASLMKRINEKTGNSFNACFLEFYNKRSGNFWVNEYEEGTVYGRIQKNSDIAVICLGNPRDMSLLHKSHNKLQYKSSILWKEMIRDGDAVTITLSNYTMFLLNGATQKWWHRGISPYHRKMHNLYSLILTFCTMEPK